MLLTEWDALICYCLIGYMLSSNICKAKLLYCTITDTHWYY